MPADALTYSFIAEELNTLLKGGKIDKIAMPERDEIIMTVHSGGRNHLLYISVGTFSRIHLTNKNLPSPAAAFSFCMHLRKNIGGGFIESIAAIPDERIINLNIIFRNELGVREDKRLACEMMGKYSNVILINADGRITDCIKRVQLDTASNRPLLPGLVYTLPELNKLSPLDFEGILEINFTHDAHNDILKNVKGLSPVSVSEAVFNANLVRIPQANAALGLDLEGKQRLATALGSLYTEKKNPCVLENYVLENYGLDNLKNTVVNDFFIRPYNCLGSFSALKFFDSLNAAVDYFYRTKSDKGRIEAKSKSLVSVTKNALKRAEKRLSEFLLKRESCKDLESDKINGELITANIYRVAAGASVLTAVNYYSEDGLEINIPLESNLSPAQNAQKYFKKYAKKKRTLMMTGEQIIKTQSEIDVLSAILEDLMGISDESELPDITATMAAAGLIKPQKRDKSARPSQPRKVSADGFNILIGKNNAQNDRITKSADRNDIWLHVKDFSGSHVIIETVSRPVPQQVLLRAAGLAAYYSKAKQADKVEVDYTLIKYVSKPSGAAPGKVVYVNQKALFVKPEE